MENLNRRNWLRIAGLTGTAALVQPWSTLANPQHRTDNSVHDTLLDVAQLSSNENPWGPSKKVREAIVDAFDIACRYPFRFAAELEAKIANKHGLSPDQVIITGGSTEGLKATGLTFGVHGGEIISPTPTYLSLVTYGAQFGAYINNVPLKDNLELDLEEMERRVSHDTKLVFVCNPNNPTGTIIPKDRLSDFCHSLSKRTIVFSDEAYYDYITVPEYPSMISLVKEGANVIVSRTFSKIYGLAGLRIGYLIARPDLAARIRKNVMAYSNGLAIHAAQVAMDDGEFYTLSQKNNTEAKEYIYSVLDQLGLRYVKSHTNFVFFHTGKDIRQLQRHFRNKNIWIGRPFPPMTDWCRISTGRMQDVKKFGDELVSQFS